VEFAGISMPLSILQKICAIELKNTHGYLPAISKTTVRINLFPNTKYVTVRLTTTNNKIYVVDIDRQSKISEISEILTKQLADRLEEQSHLLYSAKASSAK
jgi:hypothetical protein